MLIQHESGFLDLVYEPQFSSLPLDKIVSVRANSWDVLKNLDSVNRHQVHFNQHEQVWPFTGFSTLHMIATELKLEGQGHLIDYLPIDHTPKAVAFSYRMFRELPQWSNTVEEDGEVSGFAYPEDIEQMSEWLAGGDTGVVSGYLLPLFQIPEELISETLGERKLLNWIKKILFGTLTQTRTTYVAPTGNQASEKPSSESGMNEGDFRSGPAGYSPNTAYPETQYGSVFDQAADWNDGTEDDYSFDPTADIDGDLDDYSGNVGDWR